MLSDADLVAGDGEAARLVSYIRQDESPHVGYLRTALTELRDRTLIDQSGKHRSGAAIIGGFFDFAFAQSVGANRRAAVTSANEEVERSLEGNRRRDSILEQFHALGTDETPDASGPVA